jgi:oxygen-dependent protoporphyrinogen oxidase
MAIETKILVIGGGITGLCAAWHCAQYYRPQSVLLLEKSTTLGGTARTDRMSGFVSEWGPNGFLDREPKTTKWARDLGLKDKMVQANEASARRFIYKDKTLHELKPPPGFLKSGILSVGGRMRLMSEPFRPAKKDDKPESIWDFAARRIGPEAADTLVAPMVTGIFAGDAKKLCLESCFPRMAKMEREHGSLYKALKAAKKDNPNASAMGPGGRLTSFEGGIQTMLEAAAQQIKDRIKLGMEVVQIKHEDKKFKVRTADDQVIEAHAVILAVPAYAAANMIEDADKRQAATLAEIKYVNMTVASCGYRREDIKHDLNGFGFLAPRKQGIRALGCIWTSSLFPNRCPDGYVLLRTMYGGAHDANAINLTDRQLLEEIHRDLHPILEIEKTPEFVRIYRWPKAIPQYDMEHQRRLRVLDYGENQFPGLAYAGNSYRGVGINDCVVSAFRALDKVKSHLPE